MIFDITKNVFASTFEVYRNNYSDANALEKMLFYIAVVLVVIVQVPLAVLFDLAIALWGIPILAWKKFRKDK